MGVVGLRSSGVDMTPRTMSAFTTLGRARGVQRTRMDSAGGRCGVALLGAALRRLWGPMGCGGVCVLIGLVFVCVFVCFLLWCSSILVSLLSFVVVCGLFGCPFLLFFLTCDLG